MTRPLLLSNPFMSDRQPRAAPDGPEPAAFDDMVHAAHGRLPAAFRRLTEGLVLRTAEFATREVLDDLGIASRWDLLGLFQGVGLAHDGAVPATGRMPNMVFLYRRPILAYAADHAEPLMAVVTHVLVHEIGHHFGFSDDDMAAIEAAADGDEAP
jgi:predicted Zn-dependent protease with MMP-like domain